jgi:hypothetical protein
MISKTPVEETPQKRSNSISGGGKKYIKWCQLIYFIDYRK